MSVDPQSFDSLYICISIDICMLALAEIEVIYLAEFVPWYDMMGQSFTLLVPMLAVADFSITKRINTNQNNNLSM